MQDVRKVETAINLPKLKCASQAEILRSHQKDDEFVKDLRAKLVESLENFRWYQTLSKYIRSDIPFKLIYFVFTSGMGNQTLGEEYTGIVQANLKEYRVPALTVRILAAVLECFGERMLLKLLVQLQARVNRPHSELTPSATIFLNTFLSRLCAIIPILILLQKGIFYIYGRYYSLGRRITGLDYAKMYGYQPDNTVSWGLRLLGIATVVQCLLKIWQSKEEESATDIIPPNENSSRNCQLCLDKLASTATLCGHLFCWNCLSNWLRSKQQCPSCREYMPPSRIIHLMNL